MFKTERPSDATIQRVCVCVCMHLKAHQKSQPDDIIPQFLNQLKRLQEARVSLNLLLLSSQKQKGERNAYERKTEFKKKQQGDDDQDVS